MGCGQSSAAVPSASSGVSAVKSDKLVKSYAFAHVSVGTNTDKTSQNGDVIESLQFVLSDYRESPSKSQVERMMDQEETSLMLDSYDDTDEENNIPENCRYDFIQPYSQFYRPEDNWTHFSDTDDETDGEDEAKAEMKNESKSNKKDGMTKVAHVGDQKPRVYTRKDLRDNKDLIPFGRKIYSRPLLVQLVERHSVDGSNSWLYYGDSPWRENYLKEMLALLKHPECYTCQIGIYADMPPKWLVKRFQNDTLYLLSEMNYNECPELWAQLSRLRQRNSKPTDEVKPGTYLNDVVFPLPVSIQANPLVLRAWGPSYEWNTSFTDYISRAPAGPWKNYYHDYYVHPHEYFAEFVASDRIHRLDTQLEESSAWEQIQPNLLDVPTPEQERIWRVREKRTDLNDEKRMRIRRREITESLTRRHDWSLSKVEPFLLFADTLKAGWEAFQVICRMDWIPPRGPFNRRKPAQKVNMEVRK